MNRSLTVYRIPKYFYTLAILLCFVQPIQAEIKALWLMAWDINTPEKIDHAVEYAIDHGFNQLLVHARYRADALYRPNRYLDTFSNHEPISYILPDKSFDPLAYIIDKTKDTSLEIHAWATVFIATPRTLDNISPNHIYYTHPEWITRDIFDNKMEPDSHEGAYLDPGIPEVHDHLINVFKDIVINYDINGLHLDYIRYPDSCYGFADHAMKTYYNSPQAENYRVWRQDQITRFVRRCYAELKYLDPDLILSAAVVSCLDRAENRYSQKWTEWLDEGIVDYVYTMTYGLTDEVVANELFQFQSNKDRIIIGLRAWSEPERPFSSRDVRSKINLTRENRFTGLALFSFSGLEELSTRHLRRSLMTHSSPSTPLENSFIFGYAIDLSGDYLVNVEISLNGETYTYSDSNGFFFFSGLTPGINEIKGTSGKVVFFSDQFLLPDTSPISLGRYDLKFPLIMSE